MTPEMRRTHVFWPAKKAEEDWLRSATMPICRHAEQKEVWGPSVSRIILRETWSVSGDVRSNTCNLTAFEQ